MWNLKSDPTGDERRTVVTRSWGEYDGKEMGKG
jgi:hypothetical protein